MKVAFEELAPPYTTVVIDPPWMYQKQPGANHPERTKHRGRGAPVEFHYSTMTNEQVAALPLSSLVGDQAHLYLWVTNPGLDGGRFSDVTPFDMVRGWGFDYMTMLTWVKTKTGARPDDDHQPSTTGVGWYFRGQTEHVIFATRGGLGVPVERRESNVIFAPRTGHSAKPAAFGDLVERVSPGPYVELFARQPRLGWDSWGFGYEQAPAGSLTERDGGDYGDRSRPDL